jgi:ubiquinone/menaquinone biosynthesis C-methylase UbiE
MARARRSAAPFLPVFNVVVRVPVRIGIWISDQRFLLSLNNSQVGRPSPGGRVVAYLTMGWRLIRELWSSASTEYAFQLFERRNRAHYAPGGRGYVNLESVSDPDARAMYDGLESRLELLVNSYPSIIPYRDGESFLDAGCGKGQNLKFIARKFPSSPYVGFDIDERSLRVAGFGLGAVGPRSLRAGSLLDAAFLAGFSDKSFDHVFTSHVFSTLLSATTEETRNAHQRIVDSFVRIARRTVIIIDEMTLGSALEIEIEQQTRASVMENIASYFSAHVASGETIVLPQRSATAVLFLANGQ